jgi:hypothetical protein
MYLKLNAFRVSLGKPEGKRQLEDLDVDLRITLRPNLEK